jgi:hypothetical protein
MKARSPKSVRHLLKDKPTLKLLELEISAQKALLTEVRSLLPADLAGHCVAARVHDRQLVLHADSAVWATRLRYLAPQLLSLLQPRHPTLREIKPRLLHGRAPRPARRRPARRSDGAAAIIHDSAQDTKQAPLREALIRLSEAVKKTR